MRDGKRARTLEDARENAPARRDVEHDEDGAIELAGQAADEAHQSLDPAGRRADDDEVPPSNGFRTGHRAPSPLDHSVLPSSRMCYELPVVDERDERVARNEALFRQVNERLKELGEGFSLVSEVADFVCECGKASCAEPIQMTLAEYERIRAQPELFIVVPGHGMPAVEGVIEEGPGYEVVRKHEGEAAQIARETDPRG